MTRASVVAGMVNVPPSRLEPFGDVVGKPADCLQPLGGYSLASFGMAHQEQGELMPKGGRLLGIPAHQLAPPQRELIEIQVAELLK